MIPQTVKMLNAKYYMMITLAKLNLSDEVIDQRPYQYIKMCDNLRELEGREVIHVRD